MSSIGSTGGGSPATPRHAPISTARPDARPEDMKALHGAFARAGNPPLGLSATRGRGGDALSVKRRATDVPLRQQGASPVRMSGHGRRDDQSRDDGSEARERGSGVALPATAQPPAATIAMPDMPAPHVDPSAFAQLLTQLWLKQRGKCVKEVHVSFGMDAWPATDAMIVRNAAGTLDIQVILARPGADDRAMRDDLARHLTGSGLAVGALHVIS